MLTDGALRERLVARGRARAAQFEWNTVARRTLAVYDAVYHRRGPAMKLAIDARKIDDFGIGTYIQGLLDALPATGRPEALVAYLPPGRPPSAPPPPRGARAPTGGPWRRGPYSVRELWQLALAARRDRVDLYHAPHYVCPPWLPVSGGRHGARPDPPPLSRCGIAIPWRRSTRGSCSGWRCAGRAG